MVVTFKISQKTFYQEVADTIIDRHALDATQDSGTIEIQVYLYCLYILGQQIIK